ncbi:MAG TPA: molecular chaperone DnaK [Candidatus Absconditabacterales bacterium]|nr:molecular chaperone DnaK [Candidatus Absconditabacterales bacterium]
MATIIGIDLGTTNSCAAYMLNDRAEVIPNSDGMRTTPSVVYIKGSELLVGTAAKRKAILEPKNVVFEVKRFIGRKYSELSEDDKKVPYTIKAGSDGGVLIVIDDKEYKPEQISAFILKKIKEDCEKFLGQTITQAVITVPAYFNDSQRNATKGAGEIAGLKVERVINEPTAAAFSYGVDKSMSHKVCVFDLGGGTFDVTIMDIDTGEDGKTFEVKSTAGDTHLGGADFDQRIIRWLADQFKAKEGVDLTSNPMAMQRLKDEAENAKKQLSSSDSVDINIPFITTVEGTPKHIQETLTRSAFERLISDLLERCVRPVKSCINDSGLKTSEIDEIVLVGGSTRVQSVIKLVKDNFGKEPKATVNPDEAVALGAAIQGGILGGNSSVQDILLMDVTPLSLGVEVEGGLTHVMISRNTTIPVKKSNIYTTAVDNQPAVTIHVTQGERPMAADNKSLGMFNLEGIPPMRRGQAQIEVTFDIDANGILHVTALEKTTGKEQKITVQGATGLSDDDIKKAQEDAEKFAEDDKRRQELAESRNKFDQVLYQLESMLEENKDKIPEEEKTKIASMISSGQDLKKDGATTKEQFDAKFEEYQKEIMAMYQKFQATNTAPGTGANPDDILDASATNGDNPVEGKVIDA